MMTKTMMMMKKETKRSGLRHTLLKTSLFKLQGKLLTKTLKNLLLKTKIQNSFLKTSIIKKVNAPKNSLIMYFCRKQV
jgi:hypothetical protein